MENCKILLVDDEPNILRSVRRVLRTGPYQIYSAESAAAALDILEQQPVDIVISDHRMPGMTGSQLFARIRNQFPSVVGIMLSGQADMDSVIEAVNEGNIYKFLHKPWSNDGLRQVVEEAHALSVKRLHQPSGVLTLEQLCEQLDVAELRSESVILMLELRNANELRGRSDHTECRAQLKELLQQSSVASFMGLSFPVSELEGDLFALVCNDLGDAQLEKFLRELSLHTLGKSNPFSPVYGVGYAPVHKELTIVKSCRNALKALTASVTNGNAIRYSEDIRNNLHQRQSLEHDMRRGLDNGEFFLMLQPQVRCSDRQVVGAEALCRWVHGNRGMVSPQVFIDLAEENGFINQLGFWIIEKGCQILSNLVTQGSYPGKLSINVSPRQFGQRAWVDFLLTFLAEGSIPASQLELEITESSIMLDAEHSKVVLQELRDAGIRIAMDDFGTGHSSLGQISDLQVDVLKFDRSLITNIEQDEKSRRLLRNLVLMANDLGLETIAEGVETPGQAQMCTDFGCSLIQGYAYFKPMSKEDFLSLLKDGDS